MNQFILVPILLLILVIEKQSYAEEDVVEFETLPPDYEFDEECVRMTNAQNEDIEIIKNLQVPASREGRCLLACMYKKISIITPNGKYSPEAEMEAARNALVNRPKSLERAKNIIDHCTAEIEAVQDDNEGCDVAAALFTCMSVKGKEYDSDSDEDDEEDT